MKGLAAGTDHTCLGQQPHFSWGSSFLGLYAQGRLVLSTNTWTDQIQLQWLLVQEQMARGHLL